ncbi:cellulose synthase [Nocardioides sp. zg-1228]|uniref:cellulose synthase n=1 Tax=Nocardioides sp. zg-1228 TaxID=2763008 RepID=UPI0016425E21|nr:cellulose synthase [Nocardioides sp. zg-1228]MBC2935096.1 cellulose synthase [Nocardioides sp. zg-1228]QSF59778.1 hypothetical protein JX575_10280 [Nocardioides sp. zg-1228]
MEGTTWAALTAALTVAGAIWTWIAFRRRGAANGLRAMGFTLLPAAAWLTGTLEMVVDIAGSVTDWATSLVFDVRTWAGVGLAGLALVLWVVSGFIRDRQLARAQAGDAAPGRTGRRGSLPEASSTRTGPTSKPAVDDEMADIEALLRKRGIE